MLLAVDIGNTNLTCGLFKGARLLRVWRLPTYGKNAGAGFSSRLFPSFIGKKSITDVVYGSVVPAMNAKFERECGRRLGLKPAAVTPRSKLGIRLKVDKPSEVGADRLLNALAAHRLFGGPALVIDFGTATTFDCVSSEGDYLGGAIVLGPELAAKSLSFHTAKLPVVAVQKPRRVIGKNTVECIQAGLYYGYAGMINNVLELSLKEMSRGEKIRKRPRVITTGGLAGLFHQEIARADENMAHLTLLGLRFAHETIC